MQRMVSKQLAVALAGTAMMLWAGGTSEHAAAQAEPPLSGVWLDEEGKARIEVKSCGAELCGNIVWLKEPLDPNGKPWMDMLNPDKSKRGRTVCGLQIIGGLKASANGVWQGGWIYDPEEGKSFDLELSLQDPNTLKVFGYAGVRLLSETMLWKRQPADSQRCKA